MHEDASTRLDVGVQPVRRRQGQDVPLGAKAVRTRGNLMRAASAVFAEKGFLAATTNDIAERAGTSLATFYQYFPDLAGIVAALAREQVNSMLDQHVVEWDPRTGRLGLRRMIAAFVRAYLGNIEFYRLWEQVTAVDPGVAELRRSFWANYKQQVDAILAEGVAAGRVRDDLSTAELARALTYLLDRYCADLTIFDPPEVAPDPDDVIDLLTELWADAIRLVEHRP